MSVETIETDVTSSHHSGQQPAPHDPEGASSVGGSILASLVVGALTALVLTLVVFAGGTEATITGSMLLGFGLGWALLATLTARRTSQPQRWAAVPAVAMSAIGAALLAFRPGDDTL